MAAKKKAKTDVQKIMEKVEATRAVKAAEAEKAETEAKVAEEKKAEVKTEQKATTAKTTAKTTATKTTATKAAASKTTAAKLTPVIVVQCCGYEVTTDAITEKVTTAVGKSVKELNIYVKPEEGTVYYTADGEQGSVAL